MMIDFFVVACLVTYGNELMNALRGRKPLKCNTEQSIKVTDAVLKEEQNDQLNL